MQGAWVSFTPRALCNSGSLGFGVGKMSWLYAMLICMLISGDEKFENKEYTCDEDRVEHFGCSMQLIYPLFRKTCNIYSFPRLMPTRDHFITYRVLDESWTMCNEQVSLEIEVVKNKLFCCLRHL